jgi:hypothetical protein
MYKRKIIKYSYALRTEQVGEVEKGCVSLFDALGAVAAPLSRHGP